MADLQGVKRNITDMAIVCTEKQFADLCATDHDLLSKEYVRLDVKQVRGELCGGVATGGLRPGSVAEGWNKLEYNGNTYYEDIQVKILSSPDFNPGTDEISVRKLWRDVCRYTGQAIDAFPAMETLIKDKMLGVLLQDLPAV